MSLTRVFEKQYTDSKDLMRFNNLTVYGSPNQNRNQGAEVLIVAHIDTSEVENFITIDSTPVLTKTLYDMTNTIDGYYHAELLRFQLWSIATPYVQETRDVNNIITSYANLIYDTVTAKFYKTLVSNTGQAVTNPVYYKEITDFTDSEVRLNTTIEVAEFEMLFDARTRICTKNELYKLISKGCNCGTEDITKLLPYLQKKILLSGAQSKLDDSKPEQAEIIIRGLDRYCKC